MTRLEEAQSFCCFFSLTLSVLLRDDHDLHHTHHYHHAIISTSREQQFSSVYKYIHKYMIIIEKSSSRVVVSLCFLVFLYGDGGDEREREKTVLKAKRAERAKQEEKSWRMGEISLCDVLLHSQVKWRREKLESSAVSGTLLLYSQTRLKAVPKNPLIKKLVSLKNCSKCCCVCV